MIKSRILTLFFAASFMVASFIGTNQVYSFSIGLTNASVKRINEGTRECESLPKEYRPDCLQQVYKRAASPISKSDYSSARGHLNSASRNMKKIVTSNLDKAAPVIKQNRRKYRAVKKSALKAVNKQAVKIVEETKTKLLRSGGSSGDRKIHYQKIAQAVNSSKRILRS